MQWPRARIIFISAVSAFSLLAAGTALVSFTAATPTRHSTARTCLCSRTRGSPARRAPRRSPGTSRARRARPGQRDLPGQPGRRDPRAMTARRGQPDQRGHLARKDPPAAPAPPGPPARTAPQCSTAPGRQPARSATTVTFTSTPPPGCCTGRNPAAPGRPRGPASLGRQERQARPDRKGREGLRDRPQRRGGPQWPYLQFPGRGHRNHQGLDGFQRRRDPDMPEHELHSFHRPDGGRESDQLCRLQRAARHPGRPNDVQSNDGG